MCNFVTGTSKGYAFVTFERTKAAEDAYRRANGMYVDGRRILVDYERGRVMKGWVPRRLGGGFSGKKESGQLRFGARDRAFRDPM
jgi:U11/U12 small nuclear ribonucleoprotein SNRNP35